MELVLCAGNPSLSSLPKEEVLWLMFQGKLLDFFFNNTYFLLENFFSIRLGCTYYMMFPSFQSLINFSVTVTSPSNLEWWKMISIEARNYKKPIRRSFIIPYIEDKSYYFILLKKIFFKNELKFVSRNSIWFVSTKLIDYIYLTTWRRASPFSEKGRCSQSVFVLIMVLFNTISQCLAISVIIIYY